ncbi:MAG: AI-2E family transporter [Acidimicrobiia bacterium]|nr:AI-2E family transporter [Acidimicrobiia bacterium]NNL27358.1 AI-2E family transporter [Acidimicrobiia bacterium]
MTSPDRDFEMFQPRDGMPPWIPRLLFMVLWLALVTAATVWAALRLSDLLVSLFIALFLSIALEPGVKFFESRGLKRGAGTGIMFLGLVLFALGSVVAMVPLVAGQLGTLVERAPDYAQQVVDLLAERGIDVDFDPDTFLKDADIGAIAEGVAGGAFGVTSGVLGLVLRLLTIGLFTFYMTAEAPRLRRVILSAQPPHRQTEILRAYDLAIGKTGGYFYSRLLLAVIAGIIAWGVFHLIGLPFSAALALWLAVLSQFVPVVGTYVGGVLPILVGLLEDPIKAVWVVVFVVIYQQIENFLISPRITARTMALHPAVAFGAALAGGSLMGAPGALMALPVAASIQAFAGSYIDRHEVVGRASGDPSLEDGTPGPGRE